jgi:hypothetical protein
VGMSCVPGCRNNASFPFATVSNHYWVVSGQHRLEATRKYRQWLEMQRKQLPQWCREARCQLTREGLDVQDLQRLAGRLQAKSGAVISLSLSETMAVFLKDLAEFRQQNASEPSSTADLMRGVYLKTGKSLLVDGPVVCTVLCQPPTSRIAMCHACAIM